MHTHSNERGSAVFLSRTQCRTFWAPEAVLEARCVAEVVPCLAEAARAVEKGLHAAGFLAYEAAPAFDAALTAHEPGAIPLAWFGLYREVSVGPPERPADAGAYRVGPWRARVDEAAYAESIRRIRAWIAAGDTYQVNYTIPLEGRFEGDARAWFHELAAAQGGDYGAYIDTGRFRIVSASPELHFRLEGDALEVRPMKGTRRRGRWPEEDRRLAAELAASEKDRAENVMIVDLLRNDVGRVSETGSVEVPRLFDVERYETVWQMTSTVRARTRASVQDILAALFPSGSVTGAPKPHTMALIRAVEPEPRGIYCGSIGWWSPGRRAQFSVAIRTATVDTQSGLARYSVGGGITWDSTPEGEYDECLAKAAVLDFRRPEFSLLESIGFDGDWLYLPEHLGRLRASAEYFGFAVDAVGLDAALAGEASALRAAGGRWKVRVVVDRNGTWRIGRERIAERDRLRVRLAADPVDPRDIFLFHKTTHRAVYDRARALCPDCDDVLLWNTRGELTESATANLVLDMDGERYTPPLDCGLLPGVLRGRLLEEGVVRERVLAKEDLARARALWLVNSVRGWMPADLLDTPAAAAHNARFENKGADA